jgi:N-acetylneuraminate synthase
VGAVLVTLVNRDYCKKLIIMLPGQKHPNHLHKQKEETFQLLWGDLIVKMDGETVSLKPGDKLLVKQGKQHGFTSKTGAIFEEVSTRSCRNDSFYENPHIADLDPMQRKTAVEKW